MTEIESINRRLKGNRRLRFNKDNSVGCGREFFRVLEGKEIAAVIYIYIYIRCELGLR